MFRRSPLFMHLQQYNQRLINQGSRGAWRLLMAPGIGLTVVALAMIVWPELLAYMVAGLLLFAGVTLILWSWQVRKAEQRLDRHLRDIQ